jgi:hypothetical protein
MAGLLQNFLVCVLDAQYKDDSTPQFREFIVHVNILFTAIFALEMVIKLLAISPSKYFRSGWNWLDFALVALSLIDYGPFDFPNWLIRLLRALRIVRLFGRVKELTKMFSAITASLFPMMNAFIILVIVLSICACPASGRRSNLTRNQPSCCSTESTPLLRCICTPEFNFAPTPSPPLGPWQTRYWECPSSPTSRPIISASSTAPSSRCSESRPATLGWTTSPRWGRTGRSSGSLPCSCVASSS